MIHGSLLLRIAPTLLLTFFAGISAAAAAEDPAGRFVESAGIQGGLIVHLGCGDGQLTAALGEDDAYLVHGLDADPADVEKARRHVRSTGRYGRVSVSTLRGDRLPYVDNLVNLLVAEEPGDVSTEEIVRVLVPGGVGHIRMNDGRWVKVVKRWPEEIDQWTHYLHGPDNNAVAADRRATEPRSLQWISEPRFGRSHEELASISTAVTAGGRIFYIADEAPFAFIRFFGQWRLVARDAFNGSLLWKRDIPLWTDHLRHFRSGPVHLQRRLVATPERIYVTLGLDEPISALCPLSGKTEKVYEGTEFAEEILLDDGVLYLVVGTSENNRVGGGLHLRGEPEPTDFRYIAAVDAQSGEQLWKHEFSDREYLLPLTLAVRDGSVYFQSTVGVGRLDAASGKEIWRTPRATLARRMGFSAPTLVATEKVVLVADREPSAGGKAETAPAADGEVAWGVHGWSEKGFSRRGSSMIRAYDVETGEELWEAPCAEQYNAPTDVFVVDGVAWIGTGFKGHDLETGEAVRELKWRGAPVSMPHHRCYRNKATEKFIFTGRSGIEVASLEDGWIGNNSWVRGTCQYGIMPANGLVYAPPNACACNNKVKILGFAATAGERKDPADEPDPPRLQKGPAYSSPTETKQAPADAWPMFRADAVRSGHAATTVPDELKRKWTVELGTKLTQPIAVDGTVYLAAGDEHTVYALDADSGKQLWTYTAGGRIDSSPTYHQGLILFGSADGCVTCVKAGDGQLVWQFQAAPANRLIGAFGQLESLWPVHGAVLVQNDVAYVVAGRNSYLDGGLALYGLDPATGKELFQTTICQIDPETGRQTGEEGSRGFDMEGVRNDVLSGDGETVFLKHYRFDRDGRQMDETVPHLFSVDGFLGEEWFVRSYWIYHTTVAAGWGGWATMAGKAPAGRIMVFDDRDLYGYGRTTISGGPTGHRADEYHLWCKDKPAGGSAQSAKQRRRTSGKKGQDRGNPGWSNQESLIVRAMALTDGKLLVAGPPDLGKKASGLLAFENQDEALEGFLGRRGVFLRAVSTEDGATLAEHELPAMPVFDGLTAAEGRVLIALQNGTVVCLGGE